MFYILIISIFVILDVKISPDTTSLVLIDQEKSYVFVWKYFENVINDWPLFEQPGPVMDTYYALFTYFDPVLKLQCPVSTELRTSRYVENMF